MANYPISGIGQPFVKTMITNQTGFAEGVAMSWADARSGAATGDSIGQLSIGLKYAGAYRLQRGFLQFEVPENLSRIDGSVVASFYVSAFVGVASLKTVAISVDYTNFANPWSGWTASNAWNSVQFSVGAVYMTGSPYNITSAGWNHIPLTNDQLIKYHLITKRYITIAWVEYDNDYLNSSPGATSRYVNAQGSSEVNVPYITVNKPWFIDKRGNEYPVGEDFVIRASEVGVNQKDRNVQQLPFATAIPGPAFLRQRNSIYQVTKG